jgi:hypothetical protein
VTERDSAIARLPRRGAGVVRAAMQKRVAHRDDRRLAGGKARRSR